MINYWWVTRPKRNLTPVPTIFTQVVTPLYRQEWSGQRDSHLQFEQSLENAGLKRIGSRRDQTGGGATGHNSNRLLSSQQIAFPCMI